MGNNTTAGILKNEREGSEVKWVDACKKLNIDYVVIDFLDHLWLNKIKEKKIDFFLLRPPGNSESYKKLYDERIYILSQVLGYPVYPSYQECYVYENKKLLAEFLKSKELPHPNTHALHTKESALNFARKCNLPIVVKTSIGASGSGVKIIRDRSVLQNYVKKAFTKGIRRSYGPNRVVGSPKKWLNKALNSPALLIKKLKIYYQVYKEVEKDYVIFQDYIPHEFEWRAVKIGESYFAHKKIKYKDRASGSKGIEYVSPPETILNFTRDICEKLNFNFMAIDLFEDGKGGYLINELQTLFGHVQDYILAVDGNPGRFLYENNQWIFEPGNFNANESYDLRLQVAMDLYSKIKL